MTSALTFLGAFSFNGLQMCDVGAKTPDWYESLKKFASQI